MQITPLSECQIQYCLIGLPSLEPAFHHSEHWYILYFCGCFPVDFFSLFQVIASNTILLKGRFGFVISSSDFPVRHYTGKGQRPRTLHLQSWGIWPWTEGDDVQQQQWGSDCRDGQGLGIKREKNCILWCHHCINPSCLYFVWTAWECSRVFGWQIMGKHCWSCEPFLTTSLPHPKPQSLHSDQSGFPMFSSEIQGALSQVNISSLLSEPLLRLGVTLSLVCREKAMHLTESP